LAAGRSNSLIFHVESGSVHNARNLSERLSDCWFSRFVHPPYSPDLTPCDFFLFGHRRKHLKLSGYGPPDLNFCLFILLSECRWTSGTSGWVFECDCLIGIKPELNFRPLSDTDVHDIINSNLRYRWSCNCCKFERFSISVN
jgi:hypothetical protein